MRWQTTLELRGRGGEPVNFVRTINSHGVAFLPPTYHRNGGFEITLSTSAGATTAEVTSDPEGCVAVVSVSGRSEIEALGEEVAARVAHVLRLDEDLTPFYSLVSTDPELSWVGVGAGRMMRCQSVFEEIVKTICTTNCAWSATERMVGMLVEHLGERAPGAPEHGARGRAFPTPAAMAGVEDAFYRDVVRAGYRGTYLRRLAVEAAYGGVDLEALAHSSADELPDEELERVLLALPGVGPYAAAHVMLMLGRYSRLILDSWTRPTFLRLSGRSRAKDTTIARRFRRYGRYAGLAFWLYLTRSWVAEAGDGSDRASR